uniref:Uncharacterized protein n=1 Tax=Odontella aurita TaxID=265563 RepID=A0A7S4MIX6_9STRA|mmetsp:Transcript_23221/g.68647  ORF Transcript_23221/g.68647 Transcript_23221/m.68647 type:complete len:306 (+) Transcript_23221:166-1083(+)
MSLTKRNVDCAGIGGDGGDPGAVETAASAAPFMSSSFIDESAPAAGVNGKSWTNRAAANTAAAGSGGTSRQTTRARRHRRWRHLRRDFATRILLAVLAALLFVWISALASVLVRSSPQSRASEKGRRKSSTSRRLKHIRTEAAVKEDKKTGLSRRSLPGFHLSGDIWNGVGGEGENRTATGIILSESNAAPGNRPAAREGMPSSRLDRLQRLQSKRPNSVPAAAVGGVLRSKLHSRSTPRKYLFVKRIVGGQGQGNVMNGVLTAHLLGNEFNRTVCLEKGRFKYTFLQAFRPLLSEEERKACEKL